MTFDELHKDLLIIVSPVGARPDIPAESETFFSNLIDQFPGSREELLRYVNNNVGNWFKCVGDKPQWIQDAEWQFSNTGPMVFVGQIDVPRTAGWFHDDATFFLFWDSATGETKTVIQVY